VLLVLFAAAMAPTLLPQVVRQVSGHPADSAEFLDGYAEQLRPVIGRLAG
jgi:TetR/AcrR family transcriptional regulator